MMPMETQLTECSQLASSFQLMMLLPMPLLLFEQWSENSKLKNALMASHLSW